MALLHFPPGPSGDFCRSLEFVTIPADMSATVSLGSLQVEEISADLAHKRDNVRNLHSLCRYTRAKGWSLGHAVLPAASAGLSICPA